MERVANMQFLASSWQTEWSTITLWSAALIGAAFLLNNLVRSRRLRLPPAPPAWPVLGHLLSLGKVPHHTLTRLSKKYGPIFSLRLGSLQCVVVASPEMAKEILKTQDHIFASRPHSVYADTGYGPGADMVWSPLGEDLRKLRKICVTELLITKRIEQFEFVRREEIFRTVQSILEEGAEGKLVQMPVRMTELAFNNMTRTLFNKRYYGHQEESSTAVSREAREFHELMRKKASHGYFVIGEYLPYLRKLDIGGMEGKTRKLHETFDQFLTKLVEEHSVSGRGVKTTDGSRGDGDFCDVLLSLEKDMDGTGLTKRQIKGLLLNMLMAGSETTSNTVLWALAELMRHPDVRLKVQAELDAVVGRERLVGESDLAHLRYLKAVVKESFRLHPVVPLLIPHQSLKATKIAGYDIPANTRIFVNAYAIQRDPNVWENPLKYDPERFVDCPVDLKGQHFELLPFSSGRRICLGINLGELMVTLILARLLHMCDFDLPAGMNPLDVSVEEAPGVTSPMANPLEVKVSGSLPCDDLLQQRLNNPDWRPETADLSNTRDGREVEQVSLYVPARHNDFDNFPPRNITLSLLPVGPVDSCRSQLHAGSYELRVGRGNSVPISGVAFSQMHMVPGQYQILITSPL